MKQLPNYQLALIETSKLVEYALNPANERGQHKAKVFESALGFNLSNWEQLQQAVLEALPLHEAELISETPFGTKYRVDLLISGPNQQTRKLLTIWQYDCQPDGSIQDRPRLVTLYLI